MGKNRYDQLIRDGFCICPDLLHADLISRLRKTTQRLCDAMTEEHKARFRVQGSMFHTSLDPLFAELIAWPPALEALKAMGFKDPSFTDGYIISKPPRSPGLFWHYDWFVWEDPTAYDPHPQQVFLMYYLDDTCPDNGCLRVIPGSHRDHNSLYDNLAKPHNEALSSAKDLDRPEFSIRPDEINVPICAGDLLIGDARLLHATHPNTSNERRTVITLWFQPDFCDLPERIKAQMAHKTHTIPDDWPPDAREKVVRLNPVYRGHAIPYDRTYYKRNPG
ncbi:MAG: phytanoyl-CoA dioxygenase family protein [Candidatus Latescibacteria bacterium]|nr:phytanoyl-CoA dioxygenase family protein [Candidatus Latescibacterota bacterium]